MARFVMLMKVTPTGVTELKDGLPQAIGEMGQAMKALGGSLDATITLGEYDIVATGSAPSDEAIAWCASQIVFGGSLTVQTLRGFSADEWAALHGDTQFQGQGAKPFGH